MGRVWIVDEGLKTGTPCGIKLLTIYNYIAVLVGLLVVLMCIKPHMCSINSLTHVTGLRNWSCLSRGLFWSYLGNFGGGGYF